MLAAGVAAPAVYLLAALTDSVLPSEWRACVREAAIQLGMPMTFVARWVSSALLHLADWSFLALSIFVVSFTAVPWFKSFALSLSFGYPAFDAFAYIVVNELLGLKVKFSRTFLECGIELSLLAIPVGLLSWRIGNEAHEVLSRKNPKTSIPRKR